jgi:multidrug efflux pump subunit AcrA (membrane-fusion protein)
LKRDDMPAGEQPGLADLDILQRRSEEVRPRRPLLPRVLLLLLLLGGLLALYGAFVHPLLFPPREVKLARVRAITGGATQAARSLAQAAGWLEADPYPVTVRPLVAGVVERFGVLEGQTVKAGETVVAVLRSPELENALVVAEAVALARREEVALAQARLARAEAVLAQRVELRTALLAAEIEARRDRESLREAEAALALAEANLAKAEIEVRAQRALKDTGGTPPISVAQAEASYEAAKAERAMRRAGLERARIEVDVHERALLLAQEAHDQPKDLEGEVAVATSELATARAQEQQAVAERDVARRNVGHLTVKAPIDGVVMRLLAAPGAPAGPMGDMRESVTIGPGSTGALDVATGALASLYDPARLQARVEVPLADLPGIGEGTEVALEVEAVPGQVFQGKVTRLLSEANIQNNKLWVKVRLTKGDPRLKPEMLCRARFLAAASPTPGAPSGRARLEVPSGAVAGDAVFVFDPTGGGRARRVPVVKRGESGGFTEVEGSLGESNEVIVDPAGVSDGMRVKGVR